MQMQLCSTTLVRRGMIEYITTLQLIDLPLICTDILFECEFIVVCCSLLQCVAVCCSVLQCVAVCCSVLLCVICSDILFECEFASV